GRAQTQPVRTLVVDPVQVIPLADDVTQLIGDGHDAPQIGSAVPAYPSGRTALTNRDDLIAYIAAAVENFGVATLKVDVLHAAGSGDVVLTERIDHLYAPDGTEVFTLPVAGAFEVREGKIAGWRDYYDTARIQNGLAGKQALGVPCGRDRRATAGVSVRRQRS
ncbi:MAG: nuclear transport factor 2 family protein, partial [Actinobacteria bacterium]|nr:nuclear transport factor 2 family protein [Actinomycetota bacterium]